MRALVTGGAGFIGSHLVDALIERGDEVLVLDDLSTGKRENLAGALDRGASLQELDVADGSAARTAVVGFGADVAFHLAALVDIRTAGDDPERLTRVNVAGTLNIAAAAASDGVRRLVFASTAGVYPDGAALPDRLPFVEDSAGSPPSAYGESKLRAEAELNTFRDRGLSSIALRFANVYGPRQDPANEAGVVAIFCARARDGGRPTVFGDGRQTRDYIYVGDVVEALLAAQASDATGSFNIATGIETSVLELANAIGRAAGRDEFEPEFAEAREGEVERSVLDASAAEAELGWRAREAIDVGLERTLAAEG